VTYGVLLERQAERDLKRLPSQVLSRVVRDLQELSQNPRPSGCRKLVSTANDYRIRVGDYRILYEVRDDVREVRILRVRHRREVYR
jgi:mRNA interferase RelE/StbE